MEGSESEAVFDSVNLNPQLFINEVINTVDDLVDDAFNYFHEEASTVLKVQGTERAQDLSKGVDLIRKRVQSNVDKRLLMWEQYCLDHCFEVPEGFVLPKTDEAPVDGTVHQNVICDPEVDVQLDSLRNKLAKVGEESAALNRELQLLEQQSASSDRLSSLVNETLQLYDQNSFHELFQEMVKTSSELQMKTAKLMTRKAEKSKQNKTDRVYNQYKDPSRMHVSNGFSGTKLEDLQEFLDNMNTK
ncbi:protein MIS12 homolog [Argentina anserina]|uniref:protein MIS12 homolog n=1 Tax=Argentina anserina TaxID=57926 RepID=UPI002176234A|nr:protein MIS12 homolog [Potentilla anserina]